jgi:hypothetical protein
LSFLIGPPMLGLMSQIFLRTGTFVSRLFGLNVRAPSSSLRVQGWATPLRKPGEPQLSDYHDSGAKLPNATPWNWLLPSLGTMFTRMPPCPISAESAPVT